MNNFAVVSVYICVNEVRAYNFLKVRLKEVRKGAKLTKNELK